MKPFLFNERSAQNKNAYKAWSTEDDDLLERLFADGAKTKEISEQLGRNRGAISSRINKLGLRELY